MSFRHVRRVFLAAISMAVSVAAISPAVGSAHVGMQGQYLDFRQTDVNISNVRFKNAASGYDIDVMWASMQPGAGAFMWPDNASQSQRFDLIYIREDSKGYPGYEIRARHSGLCLVPKYDLVGNGTPVVQAPCHTMYHYGGGSVITDGSPYGVEGTRAWWIDYAGNGTYQLYSPQDQSCLDVANPNYPSAPRIQAPLQMWGACANLSDPWAVNQYFSVAPAG